MQLPPPYPIPHQIFTIRLLFCLWICAVVSITSLCVCNIISSIFTVYTMYLTNAIHPITHHIGRPILTSQAQLTFISFFFCVCSSLISMHTHTRTHTQTGNNGNSCMLFSYVLAYDDDGHVL